MSEKDQPPGHNKLYLFFLANMYFHLAIGALWSIGWLAFSINTDQWSWFMRSGAVTIVIGALISFRNVLRLSEAERIRFRNLTIVECFSESEKKDQERDSVAVIIGVWIMIFGTVVAAYGDLLGTIFEKAK